MDQLRIILIVLGVVLIGGIWLADRIRRRKSKWPPPDWDEIDDYNEEAVSDEESFPTQRDSSQSEEWVGSAFTARRHDVLDDAQLDELKGLASTNGDTDVQPEALHDEIPVLHDVVEFVERQVESAASQQQEAPAEEVIILTLLAGKGTRLRGPLLLKVLQECGLAHGDMDIFHYHVEGHSEPLFSIANVLEPGTFVLSEIAQMETPGIALFMRLPAPMPGSEALSLMLQKARQLAAQLNASLCDGQRQPLDDEQLARLEQLAQAFPVGR